MNFYCNKYKEVRKEKHLSMTLLAKRIGVSRRTLWAWENGERIPTEKKIRLLACKLEVDVDEISDLPKEYPTSDKMLSTRKNHPIQYIFDNDNDNDKAFTNILYKITGYRNDLKKATSLIKGLLSSMNAMFYIKDINLNYIAANELFQTVTSTLPEMRIDGKKDGFFFSKNEAKFNTDEDRNVILTGKPIINREGYIPGSRKRRWGLISKLPIFDNEKRISGVVGTFVDITDRKKKEKYRKLLEEAINKVDSCTWLGVEAVNSDGKKELQIEFFSKVLEEKYGVAKEEIALLKKGICSGSVLENSNAVRVLNNNTFPIICEHSVLSENGQKLILEEKIFKYDDFRHIGVINNVTGVRKYQKTMELLEINIKTLNDGLAIRDIDTGEFLYLNNAMETIFGFTLNNLYKNGWKFWLNNCIHENYIDREIQYNESKEWPSDVRCIKAVNYNGEERWINVSSSARKYLNRNCLISTFRDTTARKATDDITKILNQISDTVSICQKDTYKVLFVNKACEDVFGYKKEEMETKNIFNNLDICIHSEDLNIQIAYYRSKKIPQNRVYRIVHPIKGIRIIESRTTDVEYMGKKCWFMICRDITDRIN